MNTNDDRPPIGRTWTRLYALVIVWLAAQVVLFFAFTQAFK
jgi:hypothetical protein